MPLKTRRCRFKSQASPSIFACSPFLTLKLPQFRQILCVYVCVHTCTYVYMHAESWGQCPGSSSIVLCAMFLFLFPDRVSDWSQPIWLDWKASKPRKSPFSAPIVLGNTGTDCCIQIVFTLVLKIELMYHVCHSNILSVDSSFSPVCILNDYT